MGSHPANRTIGVILMQAIWCDCEAIYHGRGDTTLPLHTRLILIKNDSTILIHGDHGINPLNYMGSGTITHEQENGLRVIRCDTTRESLTIRIHRVHSELTGESLHGTDPGLTRDKTEAQLHEWLYTNLPALLPGLTITASEHRINGGAVDLYGTWLNQPALLEVKRVATTTSARQAARYVDESEEPAQGFLIALDMRPGAITHCERKNITWIELTWDGITGSIRRSNLP